MKFEQSILKTIVEKLKLRRMRFKVDPAISNLEDFDGNTSYEGYVLNENDGVLNILVIDPNNQVRQTAVFAKGVNVLSDNLNHFKRNLIKLLMNKLPEQALEQLQNAPTFDEVELIAKNNGATEDDIKNAYRTFNSESVVNEQSPFRRGQGLISRTVGKTADIAKDVLLGKEREPGARGLTGIFDIGKRVGKTLSKLGTKGSGNFKFKQRSSKYHIDRPRPGQFISINFIKNNREYEITGKIGGDFVSGNKKYIQIKNVKAEPPIPDYEKINKILMEFDLNSPRSNFFIYDDTNKFKEGFSTQVTFNKPTNAWTGDRFSSKTEEMRTDPQNKSVDQSKFGTFMYNKKEYEMVQQYKAKDGKTYVKAIAKNDPNRKVYTFDINTIRSD